MKIRALTVFLILIYSTPFRAQTGFHFYEHKNHKQQISFQLINNLIVIPIEVNGENLSFILDTGVNKTVLFDPLEKDSIYFKDTKRNMIRGLGVGGNIRTITSVNNTFKIKKIISFNEKMSVTINNPFDFSSKMGITIHGIIGYNLFKDLIIKINYKSKRITFYDPKEFTYKKCSKCETKPLIFNQNKPYVDAQISLDSLGKKFIDVQLLIDSGGSDALWLFEDSKKNIKTPKHFFNDILGEGLSGHIYGNKSRLTKFKLGEFEIEKSTVSFLDSLSTSSGTRKFQSRNGSIGGRILKRFIIWLDYPNAKITFKKNGSFTKDFNYNMSGLDVVYNGKELVKLGGFINSKDPDSKNKSSVSVFSYSYKFKPSYIINNVVPNSPAERAGLLKDDIILKINNKPTYDLILGDIFYIFQEKNKKKIKMTIKRNGEEMKFDFRLKKEI